MIYGMTGRYETTFRPYFPPVAIEKSAPDPVPDLLTVTD